MRRMPALMAHSQWKGLVGEQLRALLSAGPPRASFDAALDTADKTASGTAKYRLLTNGRWLGWAAGHLGQLGGGQLAAVAACAADAAHGVLLGMGRVTGGRSPGPRRVHRSLNISPCLRRGCAISYIYTYGSTLAQQRSELTWGVESGRICRDH